MGGWWSAIREHNFLKRRTANLVGRLEACIDAQVVGWVWSPAAADSRVIVRLQADNGATVTVTADRHRADVQKSGWGDGYCGFAVPAHLFSGANAVRGFSLDPPAELPGSPLSLRPRPRPEPHVVDDWLILIDPPKSNRRRLSGWILDPRYPPNRPIVELRIGDTAVGRSRACLFRPDADGGDDGLHGFLLHRPARSPRGRAVLRVIGSGERRAVCDIPMNA
jgi:hypothetical protein